MESDMGTYLSKTRGDAFGQQVANILSKKIGIEKMVEVTKDSEYHIDKIAMMNKVKLVIMYRGVKKPFYIDSVDWDANDPYAAYGELVKDVAAWLLLAQSANIKKEITNAVHNTLAEG
jgi:hypothetical protein